MSTATVSIASNHLTHFMSVARVVLSLLSSFISVSSIATRRSNASTLGDTITPGALVDSVCPKIPIYLKDRVKESFSVTKIYLLER